MQLDFQVHVSKSHYPSPLTVILSKFQKTDSHSFAFISYIFRGFGRGKVKGSERSRKRWAEKGRKEAVKREKRYKKQQWIREARILGVSMALKRHTRLYGVLDTFPRSIEVRRDVTSFILQYISFINRARKS